MKLSEKIRKGAGFYIAHSPNSWADHAEALEAVAAAARDWRVLGMLSKPRTAESPERRTTRNRLSEALDRLNERTD